MGLKTVSGIALAAGGLFLSGCYPLTQAPSAGTASLSPAVTSNYALMYGEAGPSLEARPVMAPPRRKILATDMSAQTAASAAPGQAAPSTRATANDPIVFSDEWWRRENEADTKLSRATKICRC